MQDKHAELKARLKVEAEAAIEELLASRRAPCEASLFDIERVVRAASQKFEQALTAELLAESAAELPAWPTCPQCGQRMKNKGKRKRRLVTETGEVEPSLWALAVERQVPQAADVAVVADGADRSRT